MDSAVPNSWHRFRKFVHLLCFAAFLALPFFKVVRFDIPRQRFYFFGYELWINEFGILFFALMFLMFLVVASSVFYGRVYCGYLCPQMIFSEASVSLESHIRKFVVKHFVDLRPSTRNGVSRSLFYAAVAAASVFLAFVFIAYFVDPVDLFHRLASLDIRTAAGISGAAVTALTFLDFSLVRQRFCTTVCPYGYLQGLLGDGNTLLVHYRDSAHDCIECKKCVRVCPMGIDIRKSPFQIECIHCGECIDACDEILARVNKPGLIHYTWGEKGERLGEREGQAWYRRIGLRDPKRVVVLLVLAFYACGLFTALAMRRPVAVRIYRMEGAGTIHNRFRYTIANRGGKPAEVVFTLHELPGGRLAMQPNPIRVAAGGVNQGEFEVSGPGALTHFNVVTSTIPGQETDTFPLTYLPPQEKKTP